MRETSKFRAFLCSVAAVPLFMSMSALAEAPAPGVRPPYAGVEDPGKIVSPKQNQSLSDTSYYYGDNTLLLKTFKSNFLQIENYNKNRVILTVDNAGKYTVAIYASPEIGWVNPKTMDLLYCFYFTVDDRSENPMPAIDCYVTGNLRSFSSPVYYPNGAVVRSGDSFYHQNGQVFYSASDESFYYSDGTVFYSKYYNSYYWPNGNVLYSDYYKSVYYSNGNIAYSDYYKSLYYENGNVFFSNSANKFYYPNGNSISNPSGGEFLDLYYENGNTLADFDASSNLMRIMYRNGVTAKTESSPYQGTVYNPSGWTVSYTSYRDGNQFIEAGQSYDTAAVAQVVGDMTFLVMNRRTYSPPPPAPYNLGFSGINAVSASASWWSAGGTTKSFRVAIASGTSKPSCSSGASTTSASYHFSNLKPDTTYTVSVCAANDRGQLSGAASGSFRTPTLALPPAPKDLKILSADFASIRLGWESQGGSTSGFLVSYAEGVTPPANCGGGRAVGDVRAYTVSGLKASTKYSFTVCAINLANQASSGVSASGQTTAPPAVPPNPSALKAAADGAYRIKLSWTSGGGSTDSFVVAYAVGSTAPGTCSSGRNVGLVTSTTLTGLKARTKYSIRVCAANKAKVRSSGVTTSATTPAALPKPPAVTNLKASDIKQTSVKLTWKSAGGSTAGFVISYVTGNDPPNCGQGTTLDARKWTTYVVKFLSAGTKYSFKVCAVNADGLYSSGSTVKITTQR